MSDYAAVSIKQAIQSLNAPQEPLYLPSIQRHFVWKPARICKLFDSIMSGFPIGTFLFWEVPDARRNEYAFYKFIQDFSEFNRYENDLAPRSLPPKITGVLDGQQRLNSMFVALTGTYEAFKGGKGRPRSSRNSYLTRRLYLNVLGQPEDEDHWNYDFDFLSDNELAWRMANKEEAWVLIGDALYWNTGDAAQKAWDEIKARLKPGFALTQEQELRGLTQLQRLYQVVNKPDLITYYTVRDRELTEALEIFVRVNSGGITLNPMDLYFSTVAAYWKEGRDEIEKFLQELNSTGNGFDYEISSLMLASLTLSGAPIQLKVESFGPAHVETIRGKWPSIQEHLRSAAKLLDSWGFSGNNHVSLYAILPVALAVRAGYQIKESVSDLRQLVIRSLLSDFFSRGTTRRNRILSLCRDFMDTDAAQHDIFSLERFAQSVELPPGSSLRIGDETIEELIGIPIWHPKTFLVLSLLHEHHAVHQTYFDKDHIHPHNGFEDLSLLSLTPEQENLWSEKRDQLPNLQLLQGGDNRSKQDKPFKEWLKDFRPDKEQRLRYLDENDIPTDCSLEFKDFPVLFEKRRQLLRKKLYAKLGGKTSPRSDATVPLKEANHT